jgi:hypothetical protein
MELNHRSSRRFLGRVEAKYDRIEKGQERDAGHQEAIDNEKKSAQRVMGYSKKERASMAKVKYGVP